MNTTPVSFFGTLVAQTLCNRNCDQDEALRLTAEAHPHVAILARGYGKTADSVLKFSARNIPPEHLADKQAATKQFREFVNERTAKGLDYTASFNAIARENPILYRRMNSSHGIEFINELNNAKGGAVPVFGPQLKALFKLPQTTAQEECVAAWQGNDSSAAPFNPAKVFDALCRWLQTPGKVTQGGITYEAALETATTRYPQLWEAVESLASQEV